MAEPVMPAMAKIVMKPCQSGLRLVDMSASTMPW